MKAFLIASLFVGELGSIVALLLYFHRRGFKRGRKEGLKSGYQEGFSDARKFSELWWEVAEKEVDEARQKIWREEERWP